MVETDTVTYKNTMRNIPAEDAVRAPGRKREGQAITTFAGWPRNGFRKSTLELV